jgi:hypothetical protein
MFPTARLVERIRSEYTAMPGLKLTKDQVCRLWGVGHDTCSAALDFLLAEGFLHQTGTGKYVALPRPACAAPAVSSGERPLALPLRCPQCGKLNLLGATSGHHLQVAVRCEGCQRLISPTKRTA